MNPSLLRLATRSFALISGAILLWVGGLLLFIAGSELRAEYRYRSGGRTLQGVVVGKELREATDDSSTAYLVSYEAEVGDSALAHRTEAVPSDVWDALQEGGAIQVQFLPGNPDSLRLARDSGNAPLLGGVVVFSAALITVGAYLGARGGRRVWHLQRVSKHGRSTVAVVTDVRETNLRVNRVTQWAIEFEYSDDRGRLQRADSGPLPPGEATSWAVGDTGTIRFDPEHPDVAVWMGPCERQSPTSP